MKIKTFTLITIICLIIGNNKVYADALDDLLRPYKEKANKITASYQYNDNYVDENGNKKNGMFILKINGMNDELKIRIDNSEKYYYYEDTNNGELIIDSVDSGLKKINIYSVKYSKFLKAINVSIPKYNYYSERIECEGITGLDVCDKWYEYELNESIFQKKIQDYKEEKKLEDKNNESKISIFFNNVFEFLKNYYLYIIGTIVLITSITIYIVIRKKKYTLE